MKDYHVNVFYSEEDEGYIADIPDIRHCSAFGATPQEALAEMLKAKVAWIKAAKAARKPVPSMGIYQGVFLFAVGFGPFPGGLLAERFGLNAPFFVFAVLGALAGVVAFPQVPETRGLREKQEGAGARPVENRQALRLLQQLRILFSRVGFVLISLVSFAQFFSRTGAIFAVVPVLGTVKLGLRADQIGTGLSLVSLLNLGMVYLSGVLADRFGRKTVIVPANRLTGISMAILALAPDYAWFVAGLAPWGISGGVAGATSSGRWRSATRSSRASRSATSTSTTPR